MIRTGAKVLSALHSKDSCKEFLESLNFFVYFCICGAEISEALTINPGFLISGENYLHSVSLRGSLRAWEAQGLFAEWSFG